MDQLQRLQELADRYGTPLIVMDHEVLRRNYSELRRLLPRVRVYYAVKANPDQARVVHINRGGKADT